MILLKELEIDQHNLFVRCQIVMLKEGKMNVKTNLIHLSRNTKSKGNKQAFSTPPSPSLPTHDK